mmetsp:Transcript_26250/g.43518  ORF Transcript_26250/g.43518 Transcript_26250/m.43518 type:complete len:438 (+) Transcript_26250:175-1488(+)
MSSDSKSKTFTQRGWDPAWLAKALADPTRPVFLAGCVPPREGTAEVQSMEICQKFCDRARCLATDGFTIYDIQDEASRTAETRPFPFRRTLPPEEFAGLFPLLSGKGTVVYKSVGEEDSEGFQSWLSRSMGVHGCSAFNIVGAASSSAEVKLKVPDAASLMIKANASFGCVCIAERHLTRRSEHLNMLRKQQMGAAWFISQAVYDADATVQLLQDYGELCRSRGMQPAKVVLTFAPCGRPKTMQFIKWLGIAMPADVEHRVEAAAVTSKQAAVNESIKICSEALSTILERSSGTGVPLGINVESVSGFREEIDGVFELFRQLQHLMLDARGVPWGVRWYRVPVGSLTRSASEQELFRLEAELEEKRKALASIKKSNRISGAATPLDIKQPNDEPASGPLQKAISLTPMPIGCLVAGALLGFVLTALSGVRVKFVRAE